MCNCEPPGISRLVTRPVIFVRLVDSSIRLEVGGLYREVEGLIAVHQQSCQAILLFRLPNKIRFLRETKVQDRVCESTATVAKRFVGNGIYRESTYSSPSQSPAFVLHNIQYSSFTIQLDDCKDE